MTIQIVLPDTSNNIHGHAFDDVARILHGGLSRLGLEATVLAGQPGPAALSIVLGAHQMPLAQLAQLPVNSIIYNLEPLGRNGTQLMPNELIRALKRFIIWDYSPKNLSEWQRHGAQRAIYVPIGYDPALERVARLQEPEQDIDLLFYGSINERRQKVLQTLKAQAPNLKLHTAFGVYGDELDNLLARSKAVLNLHFYETSILEMVRLSNLIANRVPFVTEIGAATETPEGLAALTVNAPYDELPQRCFELLNLSGEQRLAIAEQSLAGFAEQFDATRVLEEALTRSGELAVDEETKAPIEVPPLPPLAELLPDALGENDAAAQKFYRDTFATLNSTEERLLNVVGLVQQTVYSGTLKGRLFSSRILDGLTDWVGRELLGQASSGPDWTDANHVVFIATELYKTGGHSFVLDDLVNEFLREGKTVSLVLTDMRAQGNTFGIQLPDSHFQAKGVQVYRTWTGSLEDSIRVTQSTLQRLAPSACFLLQHHEDVVAIAAAQPALCPNIYYVHHCDHNLTLGVHVPHFVHLDLHQGGYKICTHNLGIDAHLMPMGHRAPELPEAPITVLTCGREAKYWAQGKFTYPQVLKALLSDPRVMVTHVGAIAEERQAQLHALLSQDEQARLQIIPSVPNLTKFIAQFRPDFYLTSYPEGGGRACIEAMSQGLKIITSRNLSHPLLDASELLPAAQHTVNWSHPDELRQLSRVADDAPRCREMALATKRHYLEHHSAALMQRFLAEPHRNHLPAIPMAEAGRDPSLEGTLEDVLARL
ncbi:hypothetical protein QU487_07795 [Crenobacter sp. SG2305]|uniref:hypothetical protein n=1 Tax=Crenobacter oryzisoli TaxID=3056844 RepID=UPI0025AA73DA|nr:hypothetical protein [Crenobacter sp. SG2305]MDN0082650.1 hypothetical protein [Crenobacter sp. SG2305]